MFSPKDTVSCFCCAQILKKDVDAINGKGGERSRLLNIVMQVGGEERAVGGGRRELARLLNIVMQVGGEGRAGGGVEGSLLGCSTF